MWLVTSVLFVPVGKCSNSRSQMLYKIAALKNLAIFPGEHLPWRFSLISFIKKKLQHRCFPANIPKRLSTAFYIEHLLFIILLCDDRILWMSSGTRLQNFEEEIWKQYLI